ncbi:MAG: cupin domain-containing protein [Vicinamibacterales bacterium]
MHPRAAELIARLGMRPHPEGGHFCEVYRSASLVVPDDDRSQRPSLTTIYFLLQAGGHSALHRVFSDEIWHFYEGDPLELIWWDASTDALSQATLGEVDSGAARRPVAVVPAGWWQAARTTGAYTLVGCTVGPGFDYVDFAMLRDDAEATRELRGRRPELAAWL